MGDKTGGERKESCTCHGVADQPATMLATTSELEEHYKKKDEVEFLKGLLEGRTLLCVGYAHNDEMVTKIVARIPDEGPIKRFTIVQERMGRDGNVDARATKVMVEDLKERWKAKAIVYPASDKLHKSVKDIIDQIEQEENAMRTSSRMRGLFEMGKAGPGPDTDWSKVAQLIAGGGSELESFLNGAKPREWTTEQMLTEGGLGRAVDGHGDGNAGLDGMGLAMRRKVRPHGGTTQEHTMGGGNT